VLGVAWVSPVSYGFAWAEQLMLQLVPVPLQQVQEQEPALARLAECLQRQRQRRDEHCH
jgi:hypothetical protein